MPADVSARYYQWFMTDDPRERIVGFEWWPEGEFVSSMTVGKMTFASREKPGDTWGPPKVVADSIPWVVAQNLAKTQGFNIEVAVTD